LRLPSAPFPLQPAVPLRRLCTPFFQGEGCVFTTSPCRPFFLFSSGTQILRVPFTAACSVNTRSPADTALQRRVFSSRYRISYFTLERFCPMVAPPLPKEASFVSAGSSRVGPEGRRFALNFGFRFFPVVDAAFPSRDDVIHSRAFWCIPFRRDGRFFLPGKTVVAETIFFSFHDARPLLLFFQAPPSADELRRKPHSVPFPPSAGRLRICKELHFFSLSGRIFLTSKKSISFFFLPIRTTRVGDVPQGERFSPL